MKWEIIGQDCVFLRECELVSLFYLHVFQFNHLGNLFTFPL